MPLWPIRVQRRPPSGRWAFQIGSRLGTGGAASAAAERGDGGVGGNALARPSRSFFVSASVSSSPFLPGENELPSAPPVRPHSRDHATHLVDPPPPPPLATGFPADPTACFCRLSSVDWMWSLSFSARSRYSSTLERIRSRSFGFFSSAVQCLAQGVRIRQMSCAYTCRPC